MSDEKKPLDDALMSPPGHALPSTKRPNLLDTRLENLPAAQRRELEKKILEEQFNLDVAAKQAEGRFVSSSRDMARDVHAVRAIEQSTRSDYEVRAHYETASGHTDLKVKRNTNASFMIIAIVIGIFVLLLLLGQ